MSMERQCESEHGILWTESTLLQRFVQPRVSELKEALEGVFKETIIYQGGYWRYPTWYGGNVQLLGSCTTSDCKNITLTGNSTSNSLEIKI